MMLQTDNLSIGYGGHTVLSDISVSLRRGSLTVLIGANGAGKSTLLRTITRSQPSLGGRIILDGNDIRSYSTSQLARRLSLVLTDRTGGGGLLVKELVAIGRHPYSGMFGRLGADDRRIIDEAIAAVGLSDKADRFVASLSDGERQKAMIARAVAQSTPLIVLDEPTSFLDVAARFEIMNLLSRIVAERGTTILLSTHDIAPAMAVATDIWAITEGAVTAGSRDDIISSGILDTVYAGARFDASGLDFRPA